MFNIMNYAQDNVIQIPIFFQNSLFKKYQKYTSSKLNDQQQIDIITANSNLKFMRQKQVKKPIQLIAFDQNKSKYVITSDIKLCPQAITLFQQLATPELHVITVAGKYRTGKSYILNRVLLNQNSGFEVGSTINACTKGLWIWPQLVKIQVNNETKDCLIVDTQGLGSLEEGQNTDIKIFLMAMLISSFLIYNSVGSIDEKALQSLSLVVNLANLLHRDNNTYDTQQLINSFPSFLWLVRDFSLKLQNQQGEKITPTQYLQNALTFQKGTSHAAQKKNSIRKQLRTFFTDRDCFTLIRPTHDERDLQNLSKLSEKRLRPEFVNLINELKDKIYMRAKPKKIRGKPITPQGFIQLCKYFVNMINSGKLPSINSHWDNLCVKQASRILQNYKDSHYTKLSDMGQDFQAIEKTHKEILMEACKKIDKSFLGKLQKELSKERLIKILQQIKAQYRLQIKQRKYSQVKEIISQIFQQIIKEFKQQKITSFEEIFARFQQIKLQYKQDTRIYQSFYQNSKDVFNQFVRNLEQYWSKQHSILNIKNDYLQTSIEKVTKDYRQQIQKLNQKNRQIEQQSYKYQLEKQKIQRQKELLIERVAYLEQQNEQIKLQVEEINQKHYEQLINNFKEQAHTHKQSINQLQTNIHILQIQNAKLEQICKQLTIKERKAHRQAQILKNKCSEYLQQNIDQTDKIQILEKKISSYEQNQRKKKEMVSVEFCVSDVVKELNSEINHLQYSLKQAEDEKKSIIKLLHEQKQANDALMKTPQNVNYLSLKKNLLYEIENNKKFAKKISDLQKLLDFASQFCCSICGKILQKDFILHHYENCLQLCTLQFDVSYIINGEKDITFQIQISTENHRWTISKSTAFIEKLLKYLGKEKDLQIFQQTEKKGQDLMNLLQERRLYLDQLINSIGHRIFKQNWLTTFFGVDIHIRPKKSPNRNKQNIKTQLTILPILQQNISGAALLKTTKFTKKSFKFGPLS